jgi:ribosome-associated heat shock protein Hsp15
MSRRDKSEDQEREVRLDKWLWAARFFKTRALAHEAIEAGRVSVNGDRAKPSRAVAVGQELRIGTQRGEFTVIVERVSAARGPATIAGTLFKETDESKSGRVELAEMHRLSRVVAPDERPNTQDRRLLRRIKEGD